MPKRGKTGKKDLNAVEIAQRQRHLYLLTKVRQNKALTTAELKELEEFEKKAEIEAKNTKNSGRSRRQSKQSLASDQVLTGQAAAAAYAGVSVRTIRNWKAAGMPVAEGGGYIKGFLDFYKRNEGSQPTEEKKQAMSADADYKSTRAKLLQMELDVKTGRLVSIDQIEAGRVARILTVKRALLGLGRKLAPQLVRLKDERSMAAIINNECRDIIKGFSG